VHLNDVCVVCSSNGADTVALLCLWLSVLSVCVDWLHWSAFVLLWIFFCLFVVVRIGGCGLRKMHAGFLQPVSDFLTEALSFLVGGFFVFVVCDCVFRCCVAIVVVA